MNRSDWIAPGEARRIALREAGIDSAEFSALSVCRDGQRSLYALDYASDEMEYCCFADAKTGEVVGFDSRPRAGSAFSLKWPGGK